MAKEKAVGMVDGHVLGSVNNVRREKRES